MIGLPRRLPTAQRSSSFWTRTVAFLQRTRRNKAWAFGFSCGSGFAFFFFKSKPRFCRSIATWRSSGYASQQPSLCALAPGAQLQGSASESKNWSDWETANSRSTFLLVLGNVLALL